MRSMQLFNIIILYRLSKVKQFFKDLKKSGNYGKETYRQKAGMDQYSDDLGAAPGRAFDFVYRIYSENAVE